MKRGIITDNEQGIHISDDEVWMTAWELADLFYTTTGTIHAAIKRILKANVLRSHEVCKYIKLENGNSADVYNLDMVIALSYQIGTGHSAAFRKWTTNRIQSPQKDKVSFLVHLGCKSYC